MGDKTGIEWTDATWNPVRGCSRVSEGCRNCYAETMAGRFAGPGQPYEGLARRSGGHSKWTGVVRLVPEHLADPLRWRRPRKVFVNSMSDLFHEALPDEAIAAVFGVMAAARQHTFQVLTKRPARMVAWFEWLDRRIAGARVAFPYDDSHWIARHLITNRARHFGAPSTVQPGGDAWPLPNVWLGVSAEDQAAADERIPFLLQTPAAVRFVSYEPALGPVDFDAIQIPGERAGLRFSSLRRQHDDRFGSSDVTLDWVIAGAESGPRARPAEFDWYRLVRDQCAAAGVAFFLKQHVEGRRKIALPALDGAQHAAYPVLP